ncbi:MAG: hypothetical protein LIP04_03040 [Tannerellaceae bacterium]|nr:hypothetical protein [Tannerellaceae bacterium]
MKRFFSKRSMVRNCLSLTSKVALTAILVFTFTACNEQDLVLDQETRWQPELPLPLAIRHPA